MRPKKFELGKKWKTAYICEVGLMMVDKSGFRTHASPVIVENLKNCARKRTLWEPNIGYAQVSKTFLYF